MLLEWDQELKSNLLFTKRGFFDTFSDEPVHQKSAPSMGNNLLVKIQS